MILLISLPDWLSLAVDWFNALPAWQLYLAIGLVAYLENVIPPIPGDLLLAFTGYLYAIDQILLTPLLVSSTIGSAAGFMTLYYVGRQWDKLNKKKVPWKYVKRIYSPRLEDRVRRAMRKWGLWLIVANRFLAGMRTVISLVSGISGISLRSAFICSHASALIWNAVIIYFGYTVGSNWEVVGDYLKDYAKWIGVGIVIIIGAKYISSLYKK